MSEVHLRENESLDNALRRFKRSCAKSGVLTELRKHLFTVEPGAFAPPPKVRSAVIRLRRNGRSSLGCDEKLFRQVVKTAFNQRRKTLRNALKPLLPDSRTLDDPAAAALLDLRAERLGVEDFVLLTNALSGRE